MSTEKISITRILEYLYTPQEAADYCRVTKGRILRAYKYEDLGGSQMNARVIRFSKQQLDKWLHR